MSDALTRHAAPHHASNPARTRYGRGRNRLSRRRIAVLLLCCATLFAPILHAEPPAAASDDGLLARILERLATQTELWTDFEETRRSELLAVPIEQRGEMRYRAPDYLEQRVLHPQPTLWQIDGDLLRMEAEGRVHELPLADSPQAEALADALLGVLNGDPTRLERSWHPVARAEAGETWRLTLRPGNRHTARLGEVQVRGHDHRIISITITEPGGDVRELRMIAR